MHRPDYDGSSIVNLMSSIANALSSRTKYRQLRVLPGRKLKRKVLLLVLDGLGYEWLMQHDSWLKSRCVGEITSVFPTTTAACVTTFLTGMAPKEHGVTGWFTYYRELGCTAMPLPSRPRLGGPMFSQLLVQPQDLFDAEPFFNKLSCKSAVVLGEDIIQSDYNSAMLKETDILKYTSFTGFLRQIRSGLRGRRYVYAYWPLLDNMAHVFGAASAQVHDHFRDLDRKLERFLTSLPDDVSVIVTADHGMIDTGESDSVWVDEHPELTDCLSMPLAGELRAAYCYVHPRCARKFERYVREELNHACTLHKSEDLVDEGYYGLKKQHPELLHRIGDYVLIMKENYVMKDYLADKLANHNIGNHGGTSREEMFVPLIVL